MTIRSLTIAFMPWISDTTVTIDVTATMLPSTVMNDRSLLAQMACSAIDDRFEDLVHGIGRRVRERPALRRQLRAASAMSAAAACTASPSASSRTEANGPVITWSPAFSPLEHLEVLLAGDAGLDRREHRLGRRAGRTRLRSPCACGRAAARSTPTRSASRLLPRAAARLFVHQCPRRRRTASRARSAPESAPPRRSARVAVVISAVQVKPGRTSGTSSSSVMTTLNVVAWRWPVPCVAAWIGLLPISVTRPRNVRSGTASIVTLAIWPSCTRRDVGLVDLDLGLDQRHVGDGQQHRAGVVHRADDRRLALLDVAAGDDAVHRRGDDDLGQVVPRRRQAGLLLLDLLFLCLDLLLRAP